MEKFFNLCAAHLPVNRDIETKFVISYFGHACGTCVALSLLNDASMHPVGLTLSVRGLSSYIII